jgi:thioredoxin-like negative regulator of GroEL
MMAELHPVFEKLPMKLLDQANFDSEVFEPDNRIKCVFFWGHNCPNCEVAKRSLEEYLPDVSTRSVDWYHVNVYNDFDLGTRFGLHGIPVFIFFKNGKNLGRITSFPGIEPFLEAVDKLLQR